MNNTTNFIFGATERELVTLSMAEIIDGLMADYKSFSSGIQAGIRIPDKKVEPRMAHSSILYAEGLRLAKTHLELAKKLILASLFDAITAKDRINIRSIEWLKANDEAELLKKVLKAIKDFEDYKAEERRKEEEEKKKYMGQAE